MVTVEPGAVNAEVVLDIGGGKTLCAIITGKSAETMELAPGKRMTAPDQGPRRSSSRLAESLKPIHNRSYR